MAIKRLLTRYPFCLFHYYKETDHSYKYLFILPHKKLYSQKLIFFVCHQVSAIFFFILMIIK